ncbi:MAG: SLATT domain-containing protein [Acetobacteraceae bacterium]|nr:SLATT domain-containing protein [Acetobacteraceae bacterium]
MNENAPPQRDLGFRNLPKLSWSEQDRAGSIEQLIDHASSEAEQVIGWYLRKVGKKRFGARALRLFAILATTAAALIPLIAQIYTGAFAPAWASVVLVLAAAAVVLDRFLGFSSGWMRFLVTELQIREALHRFHLRVETKRAACSDTGFETADVQEVIAICLDFVLALDHILRDETSHWATEFRAVLREMEEAARVQAEARRTGAVRLSFPLADQATKGWEAAIDGGAAAIYYNESATIRDLSPGKHTVQLRAEIDGQQKTARKSFTVLGGEVVNLEFR